MALTKINGDVIEANAISSTHLASGAVTHSSLSSITTDNVSEGSTNLYYSDSSVETYLDGGTSTPTFASATVSGALTVTGNLNITGDINSYNVTDLDVTDQTITLGAGQIEANSGGSGIIVDGSSASLLWNETNDVFDFNKGINVAGNLAVINSSATGTIQASSATDATFNITSAGITAYSLVTSGTDSSFSIKKDGSLRIHIDSPGNVGIGKIPNRSRFLEVAGTMNLDDGYEYEWGDGSTSIGGNSSTDVMTFNTAGAEAMRIDSTGEVKFNDKIEIGQYTYAQTNAGEAWIGRASDRHDGTMTIQLGGDSAAGTKWEIVDRAWSKVIAQISGEAPADSLVVDTSGNVGIGTVNTDSFKVYVDASSGKGLFVQSGDGGYTALGFDSDSGNARMSITGHNGELWMGGENSSGTGSQGEFRLKPGSSGGNVLYLDGTTGNVGINWGAPTARLGIIQSGSSTPGLNITDGSSSDFHVLAGYSSGLCMIGPSAGSLAIKTANTERMRIDSSGRIRMPYQPAFCVANSPGTYPVAGIFGKSDNPTAGSSYTIHVNQGSHFSTSTGRFTAPISGVYYFSFSAMFDNNTSTSPGFDFKVNGSSAYGGEGLSSGTASYEQLAGSILLTLSANDYVELSIRGSRIHQRYGSFEGFLLA